MAVVSTRTIAPVGVYRKKVLRSWVTIPEQRGDMRSLDHSSLASPVRAGI
jgi:hypothetical protein